MGCNGIQLDVYEVEDEASIVVALHREKTWAKNG